MKPELLMPAGSLKKMKWAFAYGADAVYAGVPKLSLRARENDFDLEQLKLAVEEAHSIDKKIYLTANIFARNLKLQSFRSELANWAKLKPDALIMADPGLIAIAKESHPEIPIHLSVQANCMNWEAVKFWQKSGVSRIILSRELRLDEIKMIKDKVPDMELEAFVHGSICIAYSGRCLLSHYMSFRDANQGVCDNSCRYPYKMHEKSESDYYLEDMRSPGQFYPIEEDEHGTYIMNSKDLCLIENLKEIIDTGVCSLKVEGRTKSEFYVAMVASAYRQAIDDVYDGKPFNPELNKILSDLVHRGYHKGFMMGTPTHEAQDYKPENRSLKSKFLGVVEDVNSDNEYLFEVRNKLNLGTQVQLVYPKQKIDCQVLEIRNLRGEAVQTIHPGGGKYFVKFSAPLQGNCMVVANNS